MLRSGLARLSKTQKGLKMSKKGTLADKEVIRLAIMGMTEGNGHPYSWSAIFNGYDEEAMAECPYASIPVYLGKEPKNTLQIEGARVTHICCNDPADARHVAKASLIPNVVERPEDVIGHVDAVIIATDQGFEHVDRCRPFVEAGLPLFVDKPLTDNEPDLLQFIEWVEEGHQILSSSSMRYTKEYGPYRISTHELGRLCLVTITTGKYWETYGIHALEGMYPILGPGFISAQNTGSKYRNIVHLKHESGADVVVAAIKEMIGSFGVMTLNGTAGHAVVEGGDSFYAFKAQLQTFVDFLRTGERPFPFSETVELMKLVIAGIRSREEGGREVMLSEIGG